MSVAVPYNDWSTFSPLFNLGVSAESEKLQKLLEDAFSRFKETATEEKRLAESRSSLEEVYEECSKENWDGYDAQPLTEDAYNEVWNFLDMIPSTLSMPEIVPEPNGAIALEWSKGRRSIFTISLSGNNIINYAGLFGVDQTYGVAHMLDSLPSIIVENIRRLGS